MSGKVTVFYILVMLFIKVWKIILNRLLTSIPKIYSALNYFGECSFDLFYAISEYLDLHFGNIVCILYITILSYILTTRYYHILLLRFLCVYFYTDLCGYPY